MAIAKATVPLTNDGKNGLPCPVCGDGFLTKTSDSRPRMYKDQLVTARRKKCNKCGAVSTTLEMPLASMDKLRAQMLLTLSRTILSEI